MQVLWIGWCRDETENADKVWGIGLHRQGQSSEWQSWVPNTYAIFWGRRGKKLQKQLKDMTPSEVRTLIASKEKKGYVAVAPDKVNEVYDTFAKDLFKVALSVK